MGMKRNRVRKLHSAARANSVGEAGGARRRWLFGLGVAALAALAVGGAVAYTRLRALWIEQCVVKDVSRQVTVTTGTNIKAGLILDQFGLRRGANLALIDFAEKRRAVMEKLPNIRSLTVERHLPDGVSITVEEREPVARMGVRGAGPSGRVVDQEGVVFLRQAGTALLPVIVEKGGASTPVGKRLSGRARAALKIIDAATRDFASLQVISLDVTPHDWIELTLGRNYATVDFKWDGMDAPTTSSDAALDEQLSLVRDSVNANLDGGATRWNATIQGRVTSNTGIPIK